MGNMLKGLSELIGQNGNIIGALINNQVVSNFDSARTNASTAYRTNPFSNFDSTESDIPNFATSQKRERLDTSGYPKLEYSQWSSSKDYLDAKFYYGDWYYYRRVEGIWIASKVIDEWFTQEFYWFDAQAKRYVLFVPNGYNSPKNVYKDYANGLEEFGDFYVKMLGVCVTSFAAPTIGVGYWTSTLLTGSIEFLTEIASNKGKIEQVDWFNVASNAIPTKIIGREIIKSVLDALVDYKIEDDGFVWVFGNRATKRYKNWDQALAEGLLDIISSYVVGRFNAKVIESMSTTSKGSPDNLGKKVGELMALIREFSKNLVNDKLIDAYKEIK